MAVRWVRSRSDGSSAVSHVAAGAVVLLLMTSATSGSDASGQEVEPKTGESDVQPNARVQPKTEESDVQPNARVQPKTEESDVQPNASEQREAGESDVQPNARVQPKTEESDVQPNARVQPKTEESDVQPNARVQPKTEESYVQPNASVQQKAGESDLQPNESVQPKTEESDVQPKTEESDVQPNTSVQPKTEESDVQPNTSVQWKAGESDVQPNASVQPKTEESYVQLNANKQWQAGEPDAQPKASKSAGGLRAGVSSDATNKECLVVFQCSSYVRCIYIQWRYAYEGNVPRDKEKFALVKDLCRKTVNLKGYNWTGEGKPFAPESIDEVTEVAEQTAGLAYRGQNLLFFGNERPDGTLFGAETTFLEKEYNNLVYATLPSEKRCLQYSNVFGEFRLDCDFWDDVRDGFKAFYAACELQISIDNIKEQKFKPAMYTGRFVNLSATTTTSTASRTRRCPGAWSFVMAVLALFATRVLFSRATK